MHDATLISSDSIPACDRQTDRRTDAPIMAKSRNKTRKMTNAFVCRVPLKVAHILLISQQLGLYTVCLKKPDRYD